MKIKTSAVILILILLPIYVVFPLQKAIACYSFVDYCSEKDFHLSDLHSFLIFKEIKYHCGGYTMHVKYESEKDLVYGYNYSYLSNQIELIGIYYNPNSNHLGGAGISTEEVRNMGLRPKHDGFKLPDISKYETSEWKEIKKEYLHSYHLGKFILDYLFPYDMLKFIFGF